MFKNWDWEDRFLALLFVSGIIALISLTIVSFQPKNVDYYYLSHGDNAVSCVYSHWTWHVDEKVFCTDDGAKALEFVAKANATFVKK